MIDLLIVLAFVAYSVTSGFRARKQASKNLDEYFLAGRTLTGWRAGLSMAATQFAADTPLLVTGLIATGGIFLVWRLWIYGIAFLMMGFIFAAAWRRAGVLTDAELTEIRYSGRAVLFLRGLKAVYYGTVINCVVLAMVLVAAMRIAEVFLRWNEWLPESILGIFYAITSGLDLSLGGGVTQLDPAVAAANNLISILSILAFSALYSATGGLRSVVATDVMQFGLAMVGTLIYAWIVVDAAGGLSAMMTKMSEIYGAAKTNELLSFAPGPGEMLLPFLMIIGLQWFFQMNSDGTGYLAQRSMACATDKDARIAAVVFSWMQIVVRSLIWIVIGVGLLVLYPYSPEAASGDAFVASREILFVTGIDELLPAGIRGLMLTGLLAALASTIDTHLNWGASYWSNDIYQRIVCQHYLKRDASNRELVLVARLSYIVILIIALVVMANLGSIQTAWFLSLMFGAGMGFVLVMRWLWERINMYAELAAMAASLITAPFLLYMTDVEWIRLGTMALMSTLAAVAAAYLAPQTDKSILDSFYRKVQPLGFWGETARRNGDNPLQAAARFYAEARTTILASLSLFLALVGAGKLLIRPADEAIWPALLYLLGSAILVRFWWDGAFQRQSVESVDADKVLSE